MMYATMAKIPATMQEEAINDYAKSMDAPKAHKGVKLKFKSMSVGLNGEDFRYNQVSIIKRYIGFKAPRIAVKSTGRKRTNRICRGVKRPA